MQSELSILIDQYGRLKAEADSYKKTLDADNKRIKELMIEAGKEKADGEEYHVSCKEIITPEMNEELLLKKLKEVGFTDCIQTKEYVDMDALEKAIYDGKLDANVIKECKTLKKTYRLTVGKNKE